MISTVVVTLNEGKFLKECLSSVSKQSSENIVVDLGSEDETLKIAKDFGAKIIRIHRDKSLWILMV